VAVEVDELKGVWGFADAKGVVFLHGYRIEAVRPHFDRVVVAEIFDGDGVV